MHSHTVSAIVNSLFLSFIKFVLQFDRSFKGVCTVVFLLFLLYLKLQDTPG
jgi:hypothetical protein